MKKLSKSLVAILNYIIIFSPIILSSVFFYGSRFPVWANTLTLVLFVFIFISIFTLRKTQDKNGFDVLSISFLLIGLISSLSYILFSDDKLIFNFFGKGVAQWTVITIFGLFISGVYFYNLSNKKRKVVLWTSSLAVAYTLLNFFLINKFPGLGNYSGYLNIPMVSFGTLVNFPFLFSLIALIASLVSKYIENLYEKKGLVLMSVKSKFIDYFYYLFILLLLINIIMYGFRYVGAYYYMKASDAANLGNIDDAKMYINRAITTAPFDVYYLGRIDLTNYDIQQLLNSTSTKDVIEKGYKDLVETQISDAKKAVAYDNKNADNYIALGMAYERAMLLSKEDGYKLASQQYEQARNLTKNKDYIDVIKAKLAFSINKEEDALSYLDRALKYNASSSPALFLSSQYYDSKRNLPLAISYGEKAVLTNPTAKDSQINLGLLYLKSGNYDGAIQMMASAYNLSGNQDVLPLYYLAVAYKSKGDKTNFDIVIKELENKLGSNVKEIQELKNSENKSK